jgi:hypothetical protein
LKVEALLLDDSLPSSPFVPYAGNGWDLVRVTKAGALGHQIALDPASEAVLILGQHLQKWRLARRAMLQGRHVLVDLPVAADVVQVRELERLARDHNLRMGSVNLLSSEKPIAYLKHLTSKYRLTSISILCGISQASTAVRIMKLAELVETCEWLANSKCTKISGEHTPLRSKAWALIALLSMRNSVRVLVNLCDRPRSLMQLTAVFEDAIAVADPCAQFVNVALSRAQLSNLDWRPSTLPSILDAFVNKTGKESRRSWRNQERYIRLSREVLA